MMPSAPVWRCLSKEETMSAVHILAIDLAKRSFQVCGTDRGGAVLFNRTLSYARRMQMLDAQKPCIEPHRVCRRPFRFSHAAMSGCSRMA
jgi:transposase